MQQHKKLRKKQGKRVRTWFITCSMLMFIGVLLLSQANGVTGAWTADTLRSVLGPTLTAQIESWYLGLSDTTHQIQYQLQGKHVNAPWKVQSVPLNKAYTWRSAIGVTSQGTLLYAAGDSLTAQTLAQALHTAGAVMAMQTDINPFWVRAFLYQRNQNGSLSITKLNPGMHGTGDEYLNRTARDFFYLTRTTPSSPQLVPPRTRSSGP